MLRDSTYQQMSAPAKEARFWIAGEPEVNVTSRVIAEFNDVGIPTVVSALSVRGLGVQIDETKVPKEEKASAVQVQEMVDSKDDWKIAISNGSPPTLYVFTKQALLDALSTQTTATVEVGARTASGSERLLNESAPKLLGPEASVDLVKGALALPVTQAALVGTAAGLFGLGALEDSIARPGLVTLAVFLAALAAGLSLLGTHALTTAMFVPARLDLVRSRYESMVSGPVKASNRGLILLLAAAALALFAVWPPKEDEKEQKGAISTSLQRDAMGFSAVVEASWSDLEDEVSLVETDVAQGGRTLGSARSSPKADSTVTQQLQVAVAAGDEVDVESRALDGDGNVVGDPATDTIVVPSG